MIGTVYLIKLETKLAGRVSYYVGFTTQHPLDRLQEHRTGRGSKMLAACSEKGIVFNIVRIWENVPKSFERELKNKKNHKGLCPILNRSLKHLKYKDSHK